MNKKIKHNCLIFLVSACNNNCVTQQVLNISKLKQCSWGIWDIKHKLKKKKSQLFLYACKTFNGQVITITIYDWAAPLDLFKTCSEHFHNWLKTFCIASRNETRDSKLTIDYLKLYLKQLLFRLDVQLYINEHTKVFMKKAQKWT